VKKLQESWFRQEIVKVEFRKMFVPTRNDYETASQDALYLADKHGYFLLEDSPP
jgi:hypothetical protein